MSRNSLASTEAFDDLFDSLSSSWEPARQESVVDWVEDNVELPTGAITGKVNMSYIPYGREILERYGDKKTRHLVMVFPTQAAKTTILTLGMLYRICRDAEDAMWVMGNADQARDFNKERFMPFVHQCRAAMALVPRTAKGAIDKNKWGFQSQHYMSMVLNFVGAGSTTNLSSRPRGFIQMDECDKYYDEIKFDAGTIQLAEERQKTFHFPLAVKASSPTLANRMIWTEYKKTDQRRFWIPCPRCERDILLKFKVKSDKFGDCGLRWWHEDESEAKSDGFWDMKKVRANAYYRCQECGDKIHSFERQDMLEQGEWRPSHHRAEEGRFGYQLNSMYSILGQETSLGNIAVKFLLAKGLRSELQNFVNGWLAEPWDESMAYESKDITISVFKPLEIPKTSIPIMGIDCQDKHFWVVIRKFDAPSPEFPNGRSWLLYADRVETEEDLVELQKEYDVDGKDVVVDMAYKPNVSGRMVVKNNWRGVWGTENTKQYWHPQPDGTRIARPFSVVQYRDPMLGTKWEAKTPQRARFVNFVKHSVSDMVASLRYAEPSIWHISANVSPRYARHLNSRTKIKVKNKRTNKAEWIWKELHQENHMLDCESFVTIRAMQRGLLLLPDDSTGQNTFDRDVDEEQN